MLCALGYRVFNRAWST